MAETEANKKRESESQIEPSPKRTCISTEQGSRYHHPNIVLVNELSLVDWLKEKGDMMKKFVLYSTTWWVYIPSTWAKRFIRTFIMLILDMKRVGYSLGAGVFNADNIIVLHDCPKLIRPNLRAYNSEAEKENFTQLRELILKVVFAGYEEKDMPDDLWVLLESMVEDNASEHESFLVNNYALMSGKAKAGFITQACNMKHGYNKVDLDKHRQMCASLKPTEPWAASFETISIFETLYSHKKGYQNTGEDLLRFFRNCIPHLIEYAWENKDQEVEDANYEYEDAIYMLTVILGGSLSQVQGLLYENELLEGMKVEDYFH